MELNEKMTLTLRPLLVKLLQGFVSHDNRKVWGQLLTHQEAVRIYFKALGLYLHLNREDGYAFLKTSPDEAIKLDENDVEAGADDGEEPSADSGRSDDPGIDDSGATSLFVGTSLIRKMPLTFDVSFLLVLLREALEQFDENVSDDHRLILKRQDIYDLLKTFYYSEASGGDETKQFKKYDTSISKVVTLGFLKELKLHSSVFEVRRTIKAFISATALKSIKDKMVKFAEVQNA